MIRSTFQCAPGIGPSRERMLWEIGITRWEQFLSSPEVLLSERLDERLRTALAQADEAFSAKDAERLARLIPRREHWRLWSGFAEGAACLDIETDGADTVTAIGILDAQGPRVFLHGRDLEAFPEATRSWTMLITFNGLSFDVPILRRTFPDWEPPRAHVDLRHLWGRLGYRGGLKALEREVGLHRPGHLEGVDGWEAVRLWRRHQRGDPGALKILAEYNLYDTVNLRTLMALGYNKLLEQLGLPVSPVEISWRGDVLYDLSKVIVAL